MNDSDADRRKFRSPFAVGSRGKIRYAEKGQQKKNKPDGTKQETAFSFRIRRIKFTSHVFLLASTLKITGFVNR